MRNMEKLELFLVAAEKDTKENKRKSNIFQPCIGTQGRDIYNIPFTISKEEERFDYNVVVEVSDKKT